MTAGTWIQLLTVTALVASVLSCSCPLSSPEEQFCSSDYAARIRVLNNGRVFGGSRVYKIKTEYVYRSKYPVAGFSSRYIYTGLNSASCGVNFQQGQTYVITGHFESSQGGRRVRTGLCDLIRPANGFIRPVCYTGGY